MRSFVTFQWAAAVFVAIAAGSASAQAPNAWLNEFHYDDAGADSAEFIEIIVESSFADLEHLAVVLYNGSESQLKVYATHALSTFDGGAQQQKFTVYSKLINGMQNGPDGIALCFDADDDAEFELLVKSGTSPQFVSYEGPFTPVDGCAAGVQATNIGIEETTTSPEGSSLGLVGTGTSYDDFAWIAFEANSIGDVNTGQSLGALAVHLAAFDAVADRDRVVLRWSTASEEHHAGFTVERRTSGEFVDIGFVPAEGVGGLGADYVFVDTEGGWQADAYRLRMIERTGSFSYSPIIRPPTTSGERGRPAGLSAPYPDPARDDATITWMPRHSGPARIGLHDILGREVAVLFEGAIESGSLLYVPIDVSNLVAGTYFLRGISNGSVEVRRMAVVR